MARKTISISVDDRVIEDVDMSRGNMARSKFIERVLFLFLHKGVVPQSESTREKPKEEIKEEVMGYA